MRQPKRSDDKYWTGTRIFHEQQFISDLQDHIDLLNERIEALSIADVSHRRELLIAFKEHLQGRKEDSYFVTEFVIDEFLESNL
jgi:hypothetical protein